MDKKLAYAALFDEHIDRCVGEGLARRLGGIGHKGGPELATDTIKVVIDGAVAVTLYPP